MSPEQPVETGFLQLRIGNRAGRSVATSQLHRGALRVMRPHHFDDWGVCYPVLNPGGGYLGGDRYVLDVTVEQDAALLLTTQAATKVYRTPTAPAEQLAHVRVDRGGLLELLPDQLILYRDARYRQDNRVVVDPAGTCVMSEIVTPGWSPQGEPFRYHRAALRTRVERPDGEVVLVDNLVLDPRESAMSGLGLLEGWTHAGSLLVVDRRVDAALADQVHEMSRTWPGVRAGVTLAEGPSLVVRLLGRRTADLERALRAVGDLVRGEWFGLPAVDLRKY